VRIDALTVPVTRTLLLGALPKVAAQFSAQDLHPHTVPTQTPAPTAPAMPSVEMLVTLAMSEAPVDRRRRLARDASRGLDMLERLHQELLVGVPAPARLREIVEWAQTAEHPEDPVLAQIFHDIDVRVRVELAKHDIEV
jgi:Class II flagellar assembly regulator